MSFVEPEIRTLAAPETAKLLDWAADEGWNPGIDDAPAFHAADPQGFLGAFVENEMVAGISAVAYGEDFGFIGLYICRPDMRGKGYGKAVWNAGMARLAGRTIGLDGVPEQQANYSRMGFVPQYRTVRYSGRRARTTRPGAIQPLTALSLETVETFDRAYFPAPRPAFLTNWLAPPRIALAHVEGTAMRGYGVARACREGFKIGPLFAQDDAVAIALFDALAATCNGTVHLDVPETGKDFIGLLETAGFRPGFETSRMYRGPIPAMQLRGIFGITTLELG